MPLAAAGQFRATSSISQNLRSCRNLISKTVAAGAKILFLPEASDYLPISASESLKLVKQVESNEFVLGLQESAKEHKLPICVGIHEPADGGERVKNTCVYINEEGAICQRYQKVHLFDVNIESGPVLMESRSVEPGSSITAPFDTPIGKLGMLICFDLRFPEISLQHRRLGAQVISYPSAFTVPTGNAGHWATLLRARAIETQSYVIAPALVGYHNEKRKSYGHSMIIGPWGEVLGECSGIKPSDEHDPESGEEEVCIGEIDMGVLERVRREMPLLRRTIETYMRSCSNDVEVAPKTELGVQIGLRTELNLTAINIVYKPEMATSRSQLELHLDTQVKFPQAHSHNHYKCSAMSNPSAINCQADVNAKRQKRGHSSSGALVNPLPSITDRLPPEVLMMIASSPSLAKRDKYALSRTCKSFHAATIPAIYSEFSIRTKNEVAKKGSFKTRIHLYIENACHVRRAEITSNHLIGSRIRGILPNFIGLTYLHLHLETPPPRNDHIAFLALALEMPRLKTLKVHMTFLFYRHLDPFKLENIKRVKPLPGTVVQVDLEARAAQLTTVCPLENLTLIFEHPLDRYNPQVKEDRIKLARRYSLEILNIMSIIRFGVKRLKTLNISANLCPGSLFVDSAMRLKHDWKWEMPELERIDVRVPIEQHGLLYLMEMLERPDGVGPEIYNLEDAYFWAGRVLF
ncbi:hypothetical protein H072_9541 [Dactylellina haptotyla CBS 200.50]|uniref:CN hydrolase domain-containing protein n=1 Tax=Dactylellina haptotyla (strain CBS 200.50) TaxID=1284197 RepID=S8A6Z6_DACHA|nr:hypothetical protein H072_9541 [Dactylellina haptotyla CBS 200.50]